MSGLGLSSKKAEDIVVAAAKIFLFTAAAATLLGIGFTALALRAVWG